MRAAQDAPYVVSGHHEHVVSGLVYSYDAEYVLLGTMVDWTAKVLSSPDAPVRVGGSISLRRGQTRSLAPTLIAHMIAQAIDAMPAAAPARQATH